MNVTDNNSGYETNLATACCGNPIQCKSLTSFSQLIYET